MFHGVLAASQGPLIIGSCLNTGLLSVGTRLIGGFCRLCIAYAWSFYGLGRGHAGFVVVSRRALQDLCTVY